MKPHKTRPLMLPNQLQARITDSQLFFIQAMAPNERNPAAQLRKALERLVNIALDTGTAPPAIYEHIAQHRPVRWEELRGRGPIPGAEYLPEPQFSRANGYPKPTQDAAALPPGTNDPFAGWEDDLPTAPQHHATPQHQATAQVYAPAPQVQHNPGFGQVAAQPRYTPPQPAQVAPAGPYDHLPNSQRPPMHQKVRVKPGYRMSDAELAQEGKRAEAYAIAQATGQPLPTWEHAPWEELIPDDQA